LRKRLIQVRSARLIRQMLDAIDRAQFDALWLVVKIYAFDAGVRVNLVGVLTNAHGFGWAFGAAGITVYAVFSNCISH